jgi:hypothetical protein
LWDEWGAKYAPLLSGAVGEINFILMKERKKTALLYTRQKPVLLKTDAPKRLFKLVMY